MMRMPRRDFAFVWRIPCFPLFSPSALAARAQASLLEAFREVPCTSSSSHLDSSHTPLLLGAASIFILSDLIIAFLSRTFQAEAVASRRVAIRILAVPSRIAKTVR